MIGSPAQVDVWVAEAAPGAPGAPASADGFPLDRTERRRYEAFADERAAVRFAVGRWVLKAAVAHAAGIGPSDVDVLTSCDRCAHPTHGKPRVAHQGDDLGIEVSVSHSKSTVLVATARVPIGVDVEVPARPRSDRTVAWPITNEEV